MSLFFGCLRAWRTATAIGRDVKHVQIILVFLKKVLAEDTAVRKVACNRASAAAAPMSKAALPRSSHANAGAIRSDRRRGGMLRVFAGGNTLLHFKVKSASLSHKFDAFALILIL